MIPHRPNDLPDIKTRLSAMAGDTRIPWNLYREALDRIIALEREVENLTERLFTLEGELANDNWRAR